MISSMEWPSSLRVRHSNRATLRVCPSTNGCERCRTRGPTGPSESSTPIVVTMTFSTPGKPAQRMLRIVRPLNTLSCGCVPASLVLPSYDAVEEPNEKIWRVKHFTGTLYACMCLYKITTLLGTKHFSHSSTLTRHSRGQQHHRTTSFGQTNEILLDRAYSSASPIN
ncbi:hypothetical protein BKA62DRAFT_66393 [Auriculariales sp. MPI-PUGE-AT-0066]|nr:hypothetical protein BKA62DRAFT_66393 [Auriculariales sp. MPI-PUGE-AT-0066]